MIPILYIVIPCYNEQEVLPLTAPGFLKKLQQLEQEGHISDQSRVLFVDDGSKDDTWERLQKCAEEDEHLLWDPAESKQRASERCACRTDGSERQV